MAPVGLGRLQYLKEEGSPSDVQQYIREMQDEKALAVSALDGVIDLLSTDG